MHGRLRYGEPDKPLISVIIVVVNGKDHIESAIRSVIGQTYDNVEFIVIDGGSVDGTLDIIDQYNANIDYWVSEPDLGVYDAMNKGISASNGDYILFLGCDDQLFDVLSEVAGYLNSETASYYGNVILSNDESLYGGRFHALKLFAKNIPHQAIFYSRRVFDKYSFDLKYIALADYALNLKIFSDKDCGFKYIPKTIAQYNNVDGLSSTFVDREFSLDKPALIRKYYSLVYYLAYRVLRFVFKRK